LAVLGAAVLCYAALGAVLRILPSLVADPAALGLLVGAPALTGVVTRPAGGRVADRVGAAPVMFGGAAAMAAGVAPALTWDSTGALLASRLAVGAGEGAMMSAAVLWLLRLAGPERQGQALGHIGLANYAGLTLGPLLAAALGLARAPVLVAAAALPVAGVAVAARARRPPPEPRAAARRAVLADVAGPGVALMLVNVGYVAFLAFGAETSGSALAVPVFAAAVVAVRTLGGGLPDRFGGRGTVAVATALAAAGLAGVGAGGPAVALAGTAVLALGQGLAVPALGLLALERVPAASHGAAAGLFFAFFDAGVGFGGPLAGGVARLTSPSGALVGAAAAVSAAGWIGARHPRTRLDGHPIQKTCR
jgi:predicted MFS family arabinose efflux permease